MTDLPEEHAALTAATCPAAHSMDTKWFAVDQDGFVAVFDTGEAGALPTAAGATPEGGDLDALPLFVVLAARSLAAGDFWDAIDERDEVGDGPGLALVDLAGGERPETYRDDGSGPLAELAALGEVLVEGSRPVVHVREGSELAALGASVRVERWVSVDEIHDWSWEEPKGLFVYHHADWAIPGSYARRNEPADPLLIDDVPESIRDELGKLVLEVPFAQAKELQLAEHMHDSEAVSWSQDVGLDGTAHGPTEGAPAEGSNAARALLTAVSVCMAVALLWWLIR